MPLTRRRESSVSWMLPTLLWLLAPSTAPATENSRRVEELTQRVGRLNANVLRDDERPRVRGMIQRDIRRRRAESNGQNRAEWAAIRSRSDWENYRDTRITRLRESLGVFPDPPTKLVSHVTGTVDGDGYRIHNIVYQSRPDGWVTGNLYEPQPLHKSMPALLIVHSHHRDKTHGELQDMGMTWARAGCVVLVIDQVGYGERRAHPFHSQADFSGSFKSWRQDYYYRYDSGVQLSLAGDSLMGWFVWDLMRGVDLLISRQGVDPKRILLLGSVAGGGDPCGITAALDDRIACAVPFNFGGLQPESYPLPANADENFNYAMSSYWDSTRGLPRTSADGFFHWTIVGSIAPRPLIYAHEFMWDRMNDPVWKRFQRIYADFYAAEENLGFALGKGSVRDSSDVATHCTHIGRHHRQYIHPLLEKWFGITVRPADEYSQRLTANRLICMTDEYRERLRPQPFVDLASAQGLRRVTAARTRRLATPAEERRQVLRRAIAKMLGPVDPPPTRVVDVRLEDHALPLVGVRRVVLQTDEDVSVPLLLLTPAGLSQTPVVIGVAQSGKEAFLRHRRDTIARLLNSGVAVCVPDVRGTGETVEGTGRGRTSGDTNSSVNMQMFGETILGQRLRDLRSVIRYLTTIDALDAHRIGLWGDSFVSPNPPDANFRVPHGVDRTARQPEPLGGLLAMLGALYEDDVRAVSIHRGLASFQSALQLPHVYLPHDAVIPYVLNSVDVVDVVSALNARVRLASPVDALNRPLDEQQLDEAFLNNDQNDLELARRHVPSETVAWLVDRLTAGR